MKKIPTIDIQNDFKPLYIVSEKKINVVNDIKKLANRATDVLLATDPDREGEAIA
ncbi:MAG: toprim domain-containing protein [Candidatus Pacebacteria bacterium]|nr:toprim domain-containing protein [Candidatus Paceibacterota bacterium]